MCLILICGTRAKISRICLFPDISRVKQNIRHQENCDVRLANVERRTQKLIMFEAVCLFRGRLRGANMATVIQCIMTTRSRIT